MVVVVGVIVVVVVLAVQMLAIVVLVVLVVVVVAAAVFVLPFSFSKRLPSPASYPPLATRAAGFKIAAECPLDLPDGLRVPLAKWVKTKQLSTAGPQRQIIKTYSGLDVHSCRLWTPNFGPNSPSQNPISDESLMNSLLYLNKSCERFRRIHTVKSMKQAVSEYVSNTKNRSNMIKPINCRF